MDGDLPRVSRLGCGALLFEARKEPGDAAQQRVWNVDRVAQTWTGVRETVPGMNNLMLVFDPKATDAQTLIRAVQAAWRLEPPPLAAAKLVELPVLYGGAGGPDLAALAVQAGLDVDTVVRLHAEAVYTVYFLGAHPGFAYLAGLDPRLHAPRRSEPRPRVAAGTVAIGGKQAGVIAQTTPSG